MGGVHERAHFPVKLCGESHGCGNLALAISSNGDAFADEGEGFVRFAKVDVPDVGLEIDCRHFGVAGVVLPVEGYSPSE